MRVSRFLGVGSIACCAAGAWATSIPLRNAYCPVPIHSIAQLENIVRADPPVRDRYLRHFGMSLQELELYFGTLKMTRASQPEDVVMFSVPKSGIIKSHPYHIAKGESVIVDGKGRATICPMCGNPFTLGGHNAPNAAFLLPSINEPAESGLRDLVEQTPASQVIGILSTPTSVIDEPALLADETQPETSNDVIAAAIAPAAQPQVQIIAALAAGGGGFPFLPLLGAGGLAALAASHPGGSPPVIDTVPEPAALVLFIGAPLLLLRRRS